ncbi:unnamed protein product [Arabis nemorensis]|uniref:Uncharacterized protein n=1 Tax=Arabis nemorensis TaxID=586526 RepID=A0A565C252_9BRAS|nr:unnamed protein product [Arabis nemorensis]
MTDQGENLIVSSEDVNSNGTESEAVHSFADLPQDILKEIMSRLHLRDVYRSSTNKDANNDAVERKSVPSFSDLPITILEVILSYLLLKYNLRASAVFKAWHKAAELVRIVEQHPWVISFPKSGDLVNLFDLLKRMMYTLNLPELARTSVCYSKDGWLLMRRSSLVDMFFFNPFTRELIRFPKCKLSYQVIAFSSAPTSGTCAVVAFNPATPRYRMAISICYTRATKWIIKEFQDCLPFKRLSNLLYVNGHLYCFASGARLFDFDIASRTLSSEDWDEPRYLYDIHNDEWLYHAKRCYLVEQKGELFLMYTCGPENPMVYKLVSSNCVEMNGNDFNGLTIFASLYSLETGMNIPGMRNRVYFPKYDLHQK